MKRKPKKARTLSHYLRSPYAFPAASGVLLVLALVLFFVKKGRKEQALTQPPRPVEPGAESTPDPRCTAPYYAGSVKDATETYRIPLVTLDELRQPLRGGNEFSGAHLFKGRKAVLETEHLRITTQVEKLLSSPDGVQGFRADHLVLAITNKSKVPVAYRVKTQVTSTERCGSKADLAHNAIAILPGETVRRTECLLHGRQALTVTKVDVYELTQLGYRYVSRLTPVEGGPFDFRVARAHNHAGLSPCRSMSWQVVDPSVDAWHATIDFHARHDCDEYSIPPGYRPWTEPGTLPTCLGGRPLTPL